MSENNEFPLSVFPEKMRRIIDDLHLNYLYPVPYIVGSILFVMSVVIGSAKKITTRLGDTYANIFVAIVGPQGTGKSRPVEWAVRWLRESDIKAIDAMSQDSPMPHPTRYLVSDITPEALSKLLKDNPLGVGQHVDELCKLVEDIGRYTHSANEDYLLTLFSGGGVIVDRKTEKIPIVLPKSYFSLIGTVQPGRYFSEFVDKRFDSGLFARILPFTVYEVTPLMWNLEDDLPGDPADDFAKILQNIAAARAEEITYTLSCEARDVIQVWQNTWETELDDNGRDCEVAIFRKMQIYVIKFALIIQILWDASNNQDNSRHEIKMESAVYATMATEYCFREAVDMVYYHRRTVLSENEKKVYEMLPHRFGTAEGREIANMCGMSRSAYYAMLSKIKGILLKKIERGVYEKTTAMKTISSPKPRIYN